MFRLFCAVVFAVISTTASASTILSFGDRNTNAPFLQDYQESGFTVSDGNMYRTVENGALWLSIRGGPYAYSQVITQTSGVAFALHSLDVNSSYPTKGGIFDDLIFSGFNGNELVAQVTGTTQNGLQKIYFGAEFSNLTKFVIQTVEPSNASPYGWDIAVSVDNVEVSPIPLPATLPMLLVGLAGLGWIAARKG